MSRAITVQDFRDTWNKGNEVYQQIIAMRKVPFPKVDEIAPMLGINSIPEWSGDLGMSARASVPTDYPLGNPTLDMMAGIEPVSPLALEIPANVETSLPMKSSVQTPKERTSKRPVVALPYNRVAESIMLNQVPARKEPIKRSLSTKDLENLLAAFKESGMGVTEVKSLPSGATRITFDEFFGARQEREPEFVRFSSLCKNTACPRCRIFQADFGKILCKTAPKLLVLETEV